MSTLNDTTLGNWVKADDAERGVPGVTDGEQQPTMTMCNHEMRTKTGAHDRALRRPLTVADMLPEIIVTVGPYDHTVSFDADPFIARSPGAGRQSDVFAGRSMGTEHGMGACS